MSFLDNSDSCNIANGVLHTHFSPTRDWSIPGGAIFSYKDCMVEWMGTDTEKGRLEPAYPGVFGEIASVGFLSDEFGDVGLVVRLVCPTGARCSIKAFYDKQLKVGLPVGPDDTLPEMPEIAADMVPGRVYGMWVTMQHVDKCVGEEDQKGGQFYSL
ncbi:hypothetical protein DFH09DRAFT_1323057 [Mycena vulgaris]|nr:hypothetical protein DFH09DRAFT_1323057 [Mycena vulgaris]